MWTGGVLARLWRWAEILTNNSFFNLGIKSKVFTMTPADF